MIGGSVEVSKSEVTCERITLVLRRRPDPSQHKTPMYIHVVSRASSVFITQ